MRSIKSRVEKKHVNSEHVIKSSGTERKILKSTPKITKIFLALSVAVGWEVQQNFRQIKEHLDVSMIAVR